MTPLHADAMGRTRDTWGVGISETEIVGSDDEDDGDYEDLGEIGEIGDEKGRAPGRRGGTKHGDGKGDRVGDDRGDRVGDDRGDRVGNGFGDANGYGYGYGGDGYGGGYGYARAWRRWFRPQNAPVIVSLVAVVLVVAGAAFAAVQKSRSANDFGVSLISAQYIVRQDASGIDLTLALQNTGSTMIELTGISMYQPGLIRMTQTGDAAGVTETEAGATTASALGPGTAITELALTPRDIEVLTVPFRYDCGVTTIPPVSRSVSLAGFSARGTARTAQVTLPSDVTPFQGGNVVRSALCTQPSPEANVSVLYEGETSAPQYPLGKPPRYTYTAILTAPGPNNVTINSISSDNPGIATSIDSELPITLVNGEDVNLNITWYVSSCVIATSAHSADGVKITASMQQTVQTWDQPLGNRFNADLAAGISTTCSGG